MQIQNVYKKKKKKVLSCQNNTENSYTEKKAKHKFLGYTWSLICAFDNTNNKLYFYRGEDCIEKIYKDLKELGAETINFKKKK